MTRKLIEQMLDALEHSDRDDYWREQNEAITAARAYLAQPEQSERKRCCDHDSDCAVHNMPAYPAGPCDCSQKYKEPVAWLVPDESVNSLVVSSIERLIELCKAAHHADIKVRVNGEDRWFEADWVKYLKHATPPAVAAQPKAPEPLTDEEIEALRKDAARYRWAIKNYAVCHWDVSNGRYEWLMLTEEQIDVAMGATK